jgi:transposase-like protein
MAAKYGATYPAAMKCLLADHEGLTAYLRFPAEHHHRVRHSNFISDLRRDPPASPSCGPSWTAPPEAGAA